MDQPKYVLDICGFKIWVQLCLAENYFTTPNVREL